MTSKAEEGDKMVRCNGMGGPMEVHAFAEGRACDCGKYASWWDYERREHDPLPPGSRSSWRRGIWAT